MGFAERRVAAAQEERRRQADIDTRKREDAKGKRRLAERCAARAKLLLPELDEAVALLRAHKERSLRCLASPQKEISVAYRDKRFGLCPAMTPSGSKRDVGWFIAASSSSMIIPFAGAVVASGILMDGLPAPIPIADYIRAGYGESYHYARDGEDGLVTGRADEMMEGALDKLAEHLNTVMG